MRAMQRNASASASASAGCGEQRRSRGRSRARVRAAAKGGGGDDLSTSFYDEIKRRGMAQDAGGARDGPEAPNTRKRAAAAPRFARSDTSRLSEDDLDDFGIFKSFFREEPNGGGRPSSPPAAEDVTRGQFERSRSLNSEGLEGLPDRAGTLLQLGSTFFLNFAPLVSIVLGGVGGLYYFYGEDFIHVGPTDGSGGSSGSVRARTLYDPYELLAEESMDGPRVPYYLSEAYLLQADEAPPLGATGDQQR